jgi:hypothetical protein
VGAGRAAFRAGSGGDRSRDFDTLLDQHGLSGPELDLKLEPFNRAWERLQDEERKRRQSVWRKALSSLFPRRPGGLRGRINRLLSSALRWANIILRSVGAVIPPAEAIKEFKEAFEAVSRGEQGQGGSWFARFLGIEAQDD